HDHRNVESGSPRQPLREHLQAGVIRWVGIPDGLLIGAPLQGLRGPVRLRRDRPDFEETDAKTSQGCRRCGTAVEADTQANRCGEADAEERPPQSREGPHVAEEVDERRPQRQTRQSPHEAEGEIACRPCRQAEQEGSGYRAVEPIRHRRRASNELPRIRPDTLTRDNTGDRCRRPCWLPLRLSGSLGGASSPTAQVGDHIPDVRMARVRAASHNENSRAQRYRSSGSGASSPRCAEQVANSLQDSRSLWYSIL